MKKLGLITVAVFLFLISFGIQAQTNDSKLDQLALIKQYLGKWQRTVSKDTTEFMEFEQYGKAYQYESYLIVKGKKTPMGINNFVFDSEIGKFKGFWLSYDGWCATWFCSFATEKKNYVDIVQDFNPVAVTFKYIYDFNTPTTFILSAFDKDGKKMRDFNFNKVK